MHIRTVGKRDMADAMQDLANMGWGFTVAWGLAVIFTGTFTGGDTANMGTFWFASMLGVPIGLVALALPRRLATGERAKDLLQTAALAGMVMGTAMLAASLVCDAGQAFALQLAGGLVSSLGSAVFTVLWGVRYVSLDMRRIERSATGALTLSFACYACALALPTPLAMVFVAALPFFGMLCLKAVRPQESDPDAATPAAQSGREPFSVRGFVRQGVGIVGITTVVSLFWSTVTTGGADLPRTLFSVSVLSGTVVAVLLSVYVARFSRALNLGTLYRWTLPLVAFGIALLSIGTTGATFVASLVVFAAQAMLNLLTFVYFAELSKRTGAPAHRIFGLGRFFVEVGFFIGILATPLASLAARHLDSEQAPLVFALAVLIALAMWSIAVQNRLAFTLGDEPARPTEDLGADAFQAACDRLIATYGLTKREGEILPYLASGYSLPYIRNELGISQSTIDTHVQHIYKKMGIHSREELITEVREGPYLFE